MIRAIGKWMRWTGSSNPFETRNYNQRIMENLQVYRSRFGGSKLLIEADLRRGTGVNSAAGWPQTSLLRASSAVLIGVDPVVHLRTLFL